MNVKNRKCIRKLSLKSLYANRRRNLIAIFAIALTTLLFTSMFTFGWAAMRSACSGETSLKVPCA